jgi:hypothetical protein
MNRILGPKNKLTFLTDADVILRVRITNVYNHIDSLANDPIPMQCILASVTQIYKGMNIRSCLSIGNVISAEPISCIAFEYSTNWYKEFADNMNSGAITSLYSSNDIISNNEYIIFLNNVYFDYDGINSYYSYWPSRGYSTEGGIFPIVNNQVLIPSNYFGYGTSVPLTQFNILLQNDINFITQP